MSGEWESVQVKELIDAGSAELVTGPFGTQFKAAEYTDSGIPVVNVKHIGYGALRTESLEFVNRETADRLRRHQLMANDIVFGRKGAVERHALIRPEQEGWVQGSDCIRLRMKGKELVPRFVSYFLNTREHQRWMHNQCSHGATMASLNQGILESIEIPLPPLETQKKIAGILSAYDYLIENNLKRIGIVEEMARALYREWFVYFRFPGHEKAQFVDSSMGRIPEGWEVKKVCEVCEVNPDLLRTQEAPDRIHYIDISTVKNGTISAPADLCFSEAPSRARRIVSHGDILWSSVRPNLRGFGLLYSPPANTVASTGFTILRAEERFREFLYCAVTTEDFIAYLTNNAGGAAYPAVTARIFEEKEILVPSADLIGRFHKCARALMVLGGSLRAKSIKCAASRDLLLPQLMAGRLVG
ncbi:MAG TPA: restriction endonuclease subunit S [Leptospiraceae bacterium]|nr:specificity protein S [Spirochaetaceae bacterium]HBS05822.1 restriction endonuclease subunit S [Leptospiraceae bacterium]|tara:strand:+ start:55567 stop:56811 length:1245 start_codon:yes stop_codon:yes gene_type:complete